MSEDTTSAAFARLRAQIEELQDQASTERQARAEAESELARWKARCYPTPTDVATAKVTRAKCEAWMDQAFDRSPSPTGPTWRDQDDPDHMIRADRRATTDGQQEEIARLIEWAADGQGRDQWQVLAEMSAMEVST